LPCGVILFRPDLSLFDVSGQRTLDVSVRGQILDLLAELCSSYDLTYLFISHDLVCGWAHDSRIRAGEMKSGQLSNSVATADVSTTSAPLHSKTPRRRATFADLLMPQLHFAK